MAKKAVTNSAPETVTSEAPETEATTSTAIDQPAVSDDASASSPSPSPSPSSDVESEALSSPAEPAIVEPVAEPVAEPTIIKGGGGFDFPFPEAKPAPTMVERIEMLEARVAALEAK